MYIHKLYVYMFRICTCIYGISVDPFRPLPILNLRQQLLLCGLEGHPAGARKDGTGKAVLHLEPGWNGRGALALRRNICVKICEDPTKRGVL